jgi:hypothetical protein
LKKQLVQEKPITIPSGFGPCGKILKLKITGSLSTYPQKSRGLGKQSFSFSKRAKLEMKRGTKNGWFLFQIYWSKGKNSDEFWRSNAPIKE